MKAERWQQVEHLYHAALLREPESRAAFLDEACAGDAELRGEVESLLQYDEQAARFIEAPALEVAAGLMAEDKTPTMSGRRISHYKIISSLGAGGMGEVYLAEDTTLRRKVALKLLPDFFAKDKERLRRFAQEARAASALNHPNIITIHEIGEVSTEGETTPYIVTEYVAGETLRQRIARTSGKGMKLAEAVEMAAQVAAALSAAHEAGITHRDIKPENVMVRPDRIVKVLDFGLAKLTETQALPIDSQVSTLVKLNTETGMVMGTPGYMSPEQARGERVDARTDIFSLGAMLYEMVAGRAPFAGATTSETIAALLRDEPPPLAGAPPALARIVSRALHKDRAARYQSAGDLLADLNHLKQEMMIAESKSHDPQAERLKTGVKSYRWATVVAVAAIIVAGLAFGLYRLISQTQSGANVAGPAPKIVPLTSFPGDESEPDFSPDGDRIAFVWRGPKDDNADIYVKQPGAEGLLRLTTDPAEDTGPDWSPDGRQIVFLRRSDAGNGIYVVPTLGGGERKLADVSKGPIHLISLSPPGNQNPHWAPDGRSLAIVDKASPQEPLSIFALAPETGEKRRLTTPPATAFGDTSPAFSPDGKLLAFVRVPSMGVADVYLMPATGGEPRRITFNHQPVGRVAWTPDSREIVFEPGALVGTGGLWRVPATGGTPERIVVAAGQMVLDPAVAPKGSRLAWAQSLFDANIWRVDLSGVNQRRPAPQEFISSTWLESWPEYSPDGKRILFISLRSGNIEIWVCGTEGENPVQLTDLNTHTGTPHWSPDSRQITFDSRRDGNADIYVISAEGGKPRRLTTDPAEDFAASWSRDGRWIWFGSARSGSLQIWKVPASGGEAVQMTKQGGFEGFESPDGKYFYYAKGRYISGIWRLPVAGGEETPVLDIDKAGFLRAWKVVDNGIYFAASETPSRLMIKFFDFATGKLTQVAPVEKPFHLGLSISPDGRWLIYTQVDRRGRDLMLMENFR